MTADQAPPGEFDLPDARKALAVFRYRADPKDATALLETALDEIKRLRAELAEAEDQLDSYRIRNAGHGSTIVFVEQAKDAIKAANARAEAAEAKLAAEQKASQQHDNCVYVAEKRAEAAEAVVCAARACYPTIHDHALYCEIYRDRDCTCSKRAHAAALGEAIVAYDAELSKNAQRTEQTGTNESP